MSGPAPEEFGWWLASRAAGVVALLCITISVGVGLAMAGRISKRPALVHTLLSIHQQTALVGLVAIAVHAITLLGDRFLSPSIGDLMIPFTSEHEPLWTGLGVTGAWLAAILGLSYWARHRIGARLWRRMHRATVIVYVLSVMHTVGAGTDASEPWMLALLVVTGAPIVFLFLMRVLTPAATASFRRFRVADVRPESADVLSFQLVPARGKTVAEHQPGQFISLRAQLPGKERQIRSYSLSSACCDNGYRISVKRERGGRVSGHLHETLRVGDVIEATDPAGRFVIGPASDTPVVLISAGIGVTPLLAMLEALALQRSERTVWWIHAARSGPEHAFRSEAQAHLAYLSNAHSHVRYSQPQPSDRLGRDYDAPGRLTGDDILALGIPTHAEFRLCGPQPFVNDITDALEARGVDSARITSESFGGAPVKRRAPQPAAPVVRTDGPAVEFSRSAVTTAFGPNHGSLLELAEAHAIPVASGCRIGACHGCRANVLSGTVRHEPEPLELPPRGSALLCCAVPEGDLVLDA